MKRVAIIILFFVIFFIIFFLQSNFFNWYNLGGVKPNLFIIQAMFIGLYLGRIYGFSLGLFFGFLLDLFVGKRIGINSIMLGMAGIIGGNLNRSFARDNRITFIIMTILITFFCEIINYTMQIILMNADPNFIEFMKIVGVEAIYNGILITGLYDIIQKLGEKTEVIFSENKSYMKYY